MPVEWWESHASLQSGMDGEWAKYHQSEQLGPFTALFCTEPDSTPTTGNLFKVNRH